MPEPGNDAGDNFSVAMLADQHMRPRPAIPERNHQLLGMPESQDDGSFLTIQRIHRLIAALLKPHGASNPADDQGPERRQHCKLDPLLQSFLQSGFLRALITCHISPVTRRSYIGYVLKLHRVQLLIQTIVPQ